MGKREELETTQTLVKSILVECPEARDYDMILYYEVVRRLNKDALYRPFDQVILNLKALGLPCFETVRRTRQKVQRENPSLKGCKKAQDKRAENEEVFENYALS